MSIWDKSDEIVMASHGKRADGEPRTCQVCGKEPNAMWVGADTITVCRACAKTVLPALMADASFRGLATGTSGAKSMDAFKEIWAQAESCYWRAVANNLAFAAAPPRCPADDDPDDDESESTVLFPEGGASE